MKKLRTLSAIGIMLFVLWKFVDESMIYSSAQTTSNAVTGQTAPILVHGRQLFITPDEAGRLSAFHWTSGILVLFVAGIIASTVLRRD